MVRSSTEPAPCLSETRAEPASTAVGGEVGMVGGVRSPSPLPEVDQGHRVSTLAKSHELA